MIRFQININFISIFYYFLILGIIIINNLAFCQIVNQPEHSWVSGTTWGCHGGYKKSDNQCVSIFSDTGSKSNNNNNTQENSNKNIINSASSEELKKAQKAAQLAEQEAERLRNELAKLKADQNQKKQVINNDNQIPLITLDVRYKDEVNSIVFGKVTDNMEVADVLVDGQPIIINSGGIFETTFYVPRDGKTIEIIAYDLKGNKAVKRIHLERGQIPEASGPVFASLNPSGNRVIRNNNALALIVGISNYSRTTVKAKYADNDAKMFYDYAMLKLGIPPSNIKELINNKAEKVEMGLAVKKWIARFSKQGMSDIYIFFAGHGIASSDGNNMYLLPYDGSPELLEDSAILRKELFQDIASTNPRSVTVFLDTCYSGTTRGIDMLIASRPIAIVAKEQAIPDNFTVFTAAAGDQTAKPLEEAKHGLFSYFLMKGMEGEADRNKDNTITAGELHAYIQANVIQQSAGSQTPTLQGDANRVLVRFH